MQQGTRKRLPPAERIAAILDAAANLVMREGATRINMQMVAREADVSKGLLYAYFPNITALLQEVYARENKRLHRQHIRSLRRVPQPRSDTDTPSQRHVTFENMVRTTERINRRAQPGRRLLIERLAGNPAIKAAMAVEDRRNRQQVIDFLGSEIAGSFDLPPQLARQATALALRFDEEAAELAAQASVKIPLDEIWGAMIVGAMRELESRFGGSAYKNTEDTYE